MITSEDIARANEMLSKIPFKGKAYAMVNERVKAFRQICPMGEIYTNIVNFEDGVVTMRAEVAIDGHVVATGYAQEKETSSYINKTSFIENCETSAVGRALGFLGIGIDDSMASADELANALTQQEANKSKISKKEQEILKSMIEKRALNIDNVLNGMKLEDVTGEQYQDAIKRLSKLPEVGNGKENGQGK